jgi:hypothetical protein
LFSEQLAAWFAAGGTILLGIIAIFQDRIRAHFWGPKLDCQIITNPPDCHKTTTKAWVQRVLKTLLSFHTYYYRFKIWNKGKTSAEKVEVIIVDISKKEGNNYKRVESFSLDNLVWSVPEEGRPRVFYDYISPDTYKYCTLGHIHDPKYRNDFPGEFNPDLPVKQDETIFCFDVYFRSNILYYLIGPGIYKIKIKVGCANAKTITREYELELTGKWSDDESKMLKEGLLIKEV